ncbi:hypothetical protein GE21DRAFT_1271547 [Neurospora crassa]|nr:hypothetical protein GE21DRAFT_1271547 [Neurospora crassa]
MNTSNGKAVSLPGLNRRLGSSARFLDWLFVFSTLPWTVLWLPAKSSNSGVSVFDATDALDTKVSPTPTAMKSFTAPFIPSVVATCGLDAFRSATSISFRTIFRLHFGISSCLAPATLVLLVASLAQGVSLRRAAPDASGARPDSSGVPPLDQTSQGGAWAGRQVLHTLSGTRLLDGGLTRALDTCLLVFWPFSRVVFFSSNGLRLRGGLDLDIGMTGRNSRVFHTDAEMQEIPEGRKSLKHTLGAEAGTETLQYT